MFVKLRQISIPCLKLFFKISQQRHAEYSDDTRHMSMSELQRCWYLADGQARLSDFMLSQANITVFIYFLS